MNPQSPREEIEIRITALLMGELSPEEAAALRAQIAADAELTALHVRLRRAMDLLREASAIPEQPAPPLPARFSDERRARLLAHFQTLPIAPHVATPRVVKPRRDWKWAVPLGLAASLMALIGGAMFVNGFALRKNLSVMAERQRTGNPSDELFQFVSTVSSESANGDSRESQPGRIRPEGVKRKESDRTRVASNAAAENLTQYHRWSSVDETYHTDLNEPRKGASASNARVRDKNENAEDSNFVALSPTPSSATSGMNGPDIFAGSDWDTPRVQTYFDRGTSGGDFRGGLASSRPIRDEFQRYPGKPSTTSAGGPGVDALKTTARYAKRGIVVPTQTSEVVAPPPRSALGTGALYLPKAATEVSASDFDVGIGAFTDGAFAGKADAGNVNRSFVAQAGGGGALSADKLSVSAGGVISNPASATAITREALDHTNAVAFSSLAVTKEKPDAEPLDLFNMPVVEPYAISEPFSTDGKVNLNYALAPFSGSPSPRGGIANSESESPVALHGWEERSRPLAATLHGAVIGGGDSAAPLRPAATPLPAVAVAGANGAALDFSKPAEPAEPAYPTPITTSAPIALAAAESAPQPRAADGMKRKSNVEVSGLQPGGGGLPALADVAGKGATLDLNGTLQIVGNLSGAGGVTKAGAGTLVLSDNNTYVGDTTISGGILRITGATAGVAGPQPTTGLVPSRPDQSELKPRSEMNPEQVDAARFALTAHSRSPELNAFGRPRVTAWPSHAATGEQPPAPAAELPSAGKPEAVRGFARGNTASDSQVALGRAQRELSIADPKLAAKMDSDTDGLARDGRDKPATTSLGLGLSNVEHRYDMTPRLGIKGDAANGRGEAAETLGAITITNGTEIAARRKLGEKQADGPAPFFMTPATPLVSALGDKPVLSSDAVEFEGVANYGTRIQPPAAGQPGSGPAPAPKTEHFKEATDFGTISGVITDSSATTLSKTGAGNWSLGGANTFTGGTTVNGGTLSVNGADSVAVTGAGTTTLNSLAYGGAGEAAGRRTPANGESDGGKTLAFNGTGETNVILGGVVTKSGQRADVEVKRKFAYDTEFAAPEIPKSVGGEGRGTVTKMGDGTLNWGGIVNSAPKAPVATPAPRGGDASVAADLYFEKQTAPQHRADRGMTIELMGGTKFPIEIRPSESDAKMSDDVLLGVERLRARVERQAVAEGLEPPIAARTDVAGATDESARNGQWMFSRERGKGNATDGRDDAKKSGSTAVKAVGTWDTAGKAEIFDYIRSVNISDLRGGMLEGEARKKLLEVQKKEVEELGVDRLADKSEVRFSANMPVTGKLFRAGQTAAKPAAPAGEAGPVKENEVAEDVALRDREKGKKSGDSKDGEVALKARSVSTLEKLQKDVAPAQRKQVEAKLKVTSEIAEQLQEKRVEELKSELKKIDKVAEREIEVPKPAPNPLVPQPEIRTSANAFSTFSLNVSDVAFKLAAASLERGTMPDVSTLRTEEFINAFDYRDPEARAGAPLAFASERARYPFAQNRDVVRFSVKTAAAGRAPGKPLNVVLLIDNSGSMERADRVRILREGLRTLSAQLQPQDKLSVVTFARTPRLWADGVAGDKAGEVTARVGEITPEGGTNLAAALDLGYATALRHYQPGSINHVVLLTDGAANLGNVDPAALKQKVEAHRRQGIALDCFGIGWEGLNDDMLEQLSRNGDGRYGFINTPEEAAMNFAGQLAGALRVSASDVKVQVEWNPKRVTAYRQVGYAKHQLTKEQFRDNTVDAAELAAAESGNALYVVEVNPRGEGDLATVRVRFKVPGTSDYREHEWAVPFTRAAAPLENSSSSLRLAASAAAFSEMLAGSPFATEVTSDRLLGLLSGVPAIYGADARPKKLEWMIRQAKSLSGR